MGFFRNIWDGEQRSFFRFAIITGAVFLVWAGFLRENNLVRWIHAGIELRLQNRQIERYRQDIERMDARIKTLSTDRDSLEEFARERFYLTRPGDDVYIDAK